MCHSFSSKEQVSFNFMAAVTVYSDSGAQENEIWHGFHFFLPIYLPRSDKTGCHDPQFFFFFFLEDVDFKPALPLSSYTLINRLFISSLYIVKVVSYAYLRLLIFLPAILIPACESSGPAFHMMCSAYKLNKQNDNIQLLHTLFTVLNQSIVPYPVLTVVFYSTYGFLRRRAM